MIFCACPVIFLAQKIRTLPSAGILTVQRLLGYIEVEVLFAFKGIVSYYELFLKGGTSMESFFKIERFSNLEGGEPTIMVQAQSTVPVVRDRVFAMEFTTNALDTAIVTLQQARRDLREKNKKRKKIINL